jgi:hypothetical protein
MYAKIGFWIESRMTAAWARTLRFSDVTRREHAEAVALVSAEALSPCVFHSVSPLGALQCLGRSEMIERNITMRARSSVEKSR